MEYPLKTPQKYELCQVNGLLECPEGDKCLSGRTAYLPGHNVHIRLKHTYDDQYIGLLIPGGLEFLRESRAAWTPYLTN